MKLENILKKKEMLAAKVKDFYDESETKKLVNDLYGDYPDEFDHFVDIVKEMKVADVIKKLSSNVQNLKREMTDIVERLSTPEKAYNDVFNVLDYLKKKANNWLLEE